VDREIRLRVRNHRFGQLAAVERIAVRRGDPFERAPSAGNETPPARGASSGMKCSANPSSCGSASTAAAHCSATTGDTA
jgi:hypothetical protein